MFTYSYNQIPSTGSEAIFTVKQTLKVTSWLVKSSSDGTTYNSTGDQITGAASGANGMANTSAWFRIQSPMATLQTREFVFQRGTNDVSWRIKYSPSAGFTGGSPGSTQAPSAVDEVVVFGGGTDVSPTYSTLWTTNGNYRLHMAVGGSSENYSFYFTAFNFSSVAITGFALDVMQNGSYQSADLDPAVVYVAYNVSNIWGSNIRGGTGPKGFMGAISPSNFVVVPLVTMTDFPGVLGTNSWSNKDDAIPVFYLRSSSPNSGVKGWSSLFYYNSVGRGTLDVLSVTSNRDRLYSDGLLLPWSGDLVAR